MIGLRHACLLDSNASTRVKWPLLPILLAPHELSLDGIIRNWWEAQERQSLIRPTLFGQLVRYGVESSYAQLSSFICIAMFICEMLPFD